MTILMWILSKERKRHQKSPALLLGLTLLSEPAKRKLSTNIFYYPLDKSNRVTASVKINKLAIFHALGYHGNVFVCYFVAEREQNRFTSCPL